jgi:anti-sigma factor (TIGR02949 family)
VTRTDLDCEEALRRLFEFLDHELAPEERDAMQRHLQTCRSCYSRSEFERRLKAKLHELRQDDAPIDPQERIRRLLQSF